MGVGVNPRARAADSDGLAVATVHGGTVVLVATAPLKLLTVSLQSEQRAWRQEGPHAEVEADRVLRDLVLHPGRFGWRREVQVDLNLPGRVVHAELVYVGGVESRGVRRDVATWLHARARDAWLTQSQQEVLSVVACALLGHADLRDYRQDSPRSWATGGSHRAHCTCGHIVPWRWARIAGFRVRVPAMHPGRVEAGPRGMCPRAEACHEVLDPVLPWDEGQEESEGILDREAWWQQALACVPPGLQGEGGS